MIQLKEGVRINGLTSEMGLGVHIVGSVFAAHDKNCVLTSVADGKHSRGSKHYSGNGADFRTRHLLVSERDKITIDCKKSLGDDFDVVLESDHLHVEYDPKEPY